MKRALLAATAAVYLSLTGLAAAGEGIAKGDTSGKKIALANNYAGNSWRQAMLRSWKETVDQARADKLVADGPAYTTSENSATEQAQQVQNLVLQGVNAIVLDASSPTALNGAVKQACDAGIIVVSFDNLATELCAWRISTDNTSMGVTEVEYAAKRLNGKGNILEVRGLAGTSIDTEIHTGVEKTLKQYPGLKRVGEVHGSWTQTVAQKEVAGVLPTLPKIDAVVTQGGDGYGTAQAFLAAGRPLPIIVMGNRYDELKFWKEQHDKNGYETMSISSAPALAQIGFWVAQQILAGKTVPHDLIVPLLTIHQNDFDYWFGRTPEGGVSNATYTQAWTAQVIDAVAAGKPSPDTPK